MNIIQLLTADHRKVDEMLAELKTRTRADEQLLTKLEQEIRLHSEIEEAIFYPELRTHPETSELVTEAYEEHAEVDQLLARLRSGGDMQGTLAELESSINHHVEEEENQLFPKATQVLGEGRLLELGRRMQELKSKGLWAA